MKRVLLSCLLVLASFSTGNAVAGGDGPKPLGPRQFFEEVQGTYRVALVDGAVPPGSGSVAAIEVGPDRVVLALPLCSSGGDCDPGEEVFPLEFASVVQDNGTYLITFHGLTQSYRFSWRRSGDRIIFRNYQHSLDGEKQGVLEHVLVAPRS
jgi:hypothetical protein